MTPISEKESSLEQTYGTQGYTQKFDHTSKPVPLGSIYVNKHDETIIKASGKYNLDQFENDEEDEYQDDFEDVLIIKLT